MSNTLENVCEDAVCALTRQYEEVRSERRAGTGLWLRAVEVQNPWTSVSSPWAMAPLTPFDCNVGCVRFLTVMAHPPYLCDIDLVWLRTNEGVDNNAITVSIMVPTVHNSSYHSVPPWDPHEQLYWHGKSLIISWTGNLSFDFHFLPGLFIPSVCLDTLPSPDR